MKNRIFLFGLAMTALCSAREWTSSDGRKLEAEFVSASGGKVVLKLASNGQVMPLDLTRLSAADQA